MLQRTLPAGFMAPCLQTKTDKLPSGSQWLHEIKHDGFRIIARNRVQARTWFLAYVWLARMLRIHSLYNSVQTRRQAMLTSKRL
jgi:hypothetical protein